MGPNGPALETLVEDFLSLDPQARETLCLIGGEHFRDCLNEFETFALVDFMRHPDQAYPPIARRLGVFSDVELKTRIVGILDYFSQSVLRPLHD